MNVRSTFRCSAEANNRAWWGFIKKAARKFPENMKGVLFIGYGSERSLIFCAISALVDSSSGDKKKETFTKI